MNEILEITRKNLKRRQYRVTVVSSRQEAVDHLTEVIRDTTVGIGGSVTVQELGLYDALVKNNTVFWHWVDGPSVLADAMTTETYISSANGVSETGEIVNIDGVGNRLASMMYGHRRLFFVVGRNKIVPSLAAAIDRAQNVAAPKNARRLQKKAPCALRADKCYNCIGKNRACRGMLILSGPPVSVDAEVVLIDDDLGY